MIFILQKYLTKSIRDGFSKICSDYFDATKLVQLKIESDSWRAQLDKLKPKSGTIAEDVSQYCKLQEGDAVLLAIGHRMDAVSIKSGFSLSLLMINCFLLMCNYD